jgi:hypothetical protein
MAKVECPNCAGFPTEQDEDGRYYSCYTCGDTGWVEDTISDKVKILVLQVALRDLIGLIEYGCPDEIHMAAPDVRAAVEALEVTK